MNTFGWTVLATVIGGIASHYAIRTLQRQEVEQETRQDLANQAFNIAAYKQFNDAPDVVGSGESEGFGIPRFTF